MDTQSLFSLAGRTALVTGGSRGIGKMIATGFIAQGAKVYISSRKADVCEAVAEELGPNCIAVPQDISTVDGCKALAATMAEHESGIDILVNNAVSTQPRPLMKLSLDAFQQSLRVGPIAALKLMQLVQPLMLEQGEGHIINLASTAAMRWDNARYGAYAAEKEAIRALSRGAACEWGPLGIRTNVILPHAKSPALAGWADANPKEAAAFEASIPLGRIGDCEQDIGEFVALLCSPEASYVNGQSIAVDGGQANLG